MEIEFPPDLQAELDEESRLSEMPVEKLVIISVAEHFASSRRLPQGEPLKSPYRKEDFPPGSLAERLAPYIGVLDSREFGPDVQDLLPLSENTGEKFAKLLMEKHRKRRS